MATSEKQFDLPQPASQPILAWEAPEYRQFDKGIMWTVTLWSIAPAIAGGIIWYYGVTFFGIVSALVPLAAALALTTQGHIKPQLVRMVIDQRGVTFRGQLFAWSELKGFWLVFHEHNQALYLETTRRLFPVIGIQIGKTDPELIRTTLLKHLPEQANRKEDLSDRLAHLIKF